MQRAPALAIAFSFMLACGCQSTGGDSVASRLWPFGKDNEQLASSAAPKISLPSESATPATLSGGTQVAANNRAGAAPGSSPSEPPSFDASPASPYQQAGYSAGSGTIQEQPAPQYGQNYAMPNTQANAGAAPSNGSPQVGRYDPSGYAPPPASAPEASSPLGDRYADYTPQQTPLPANSGYADYQAPDSGTRYGGGSENQAARYGEVVNNDPPSSAMPAAVGDRYASAAGANYVGGGAPGDTGYQPPQVPGTSQTQGIPPYQSPTEPYQSPAAGYQPPAGSGPTPFRPGSTGRSIGSGSAATSGSSPLGQATQTNYAPTSGDVTNGPPSYSLPAAGPNYLP